MDDRSCINDLEEYATVWVGCFLELRGRTHCWNRNGKKVNWMNEKGCILPGTKIGIVMTMTIMKMSKMQTLMCLQQRWKNV